MPAVTSDKAVERLTKIIEDELAPEELREVYNELFEEDQYTAEEVEEDSWPLVEQLVEYLSGERDSEEIVQVWNLVCPADRHVWYDEEESLYHYDAEKPQAVD